jgi:hypothetical protein
MRSTSWKQLALIAACAAVPATAAPPAPAGEYRLDATVRVRASGLPEEQLREEGRAVVSPAGPGRVRVRLAARGKSCELQARAGPKGELAFEAGQRCLFELDENEGARGRVEGTLRSGSGRAQGDALELDLAWELSGVVRMQLGGQRIQVMGSELAIPDGLAPETPVRGTAEARVEGRRSGARR